MEERVLEDIEFHQDFIRSEKPSPLNMIREKEMELTGRVLACKKDAEKVVAQARKKAGEMVADAEEEAARLALDREGEIVAAAEEEAERIRTESKARLAAMAQEIDARKQQAADAVVRMVVED